ncbi:MAG: hypothetical protein AB7J13_09030 [Pyrinomonadaceae bacterium]
MDDKLYCPRCGKASIDGTSYCRTCGLALDRVLEIVSGQAETAPKVTSRPNFKLFRVGIGLFILGLVIGLINGALRDFNLFPESYGRLVFLLLVAAGMLTLGAGFVFPTKRYTKRNTADTTDGSDPDLGLATGPLARALDPASEDSYIAPRVKRERERVAAGSVTEETTRNLG